MSQGSQIVDNLDFGTSCFFARPIPTHPSSHRTLRTSPGSDIGFAVMRKSHLDPLHDHHRDSSGFWPALQRLLPGFAGGARAKSTVQRETEPTPLAYSPLPTFPG